MEDRVPHTAGQAFIPKNESGVAAILADSFPQIRVRESSHYSTGKYIRIYFPSDEKYLIRGEGEDSRSLGEAAALISTHLGQQGIKCRFETYDEADSLIRYSHHDWPPPGKHQ